MMTSKLKWYFNPFRYDDTYDSTDIKLDATVDLDFEQDSELMEAEDAKPVESVNSAELFESLLVNMFNTDPSIFDASNRKHPKRLQLAQKTQMSNEQIEGWYKMLLRNVCYQRLFFNILIATKRIYFAKV